VDAIPTSVDRALSVAEESAGEPSAAARVRDFRARASPGAQRLAQVLSCAPRLSLPLIRILQRELAPETGTLELAEVFVGGLLNVSTDRSGGGDAYSFHPGVRSELDSGLTVLEQWDAFAAASAYLAGRLGTDSSRSLVALVADPAGRQSIDPSVQPFAEMVHDLAAQLFVDDSSTTQTPAAGRGPNEGGRMAEDEDFWDDLLAHIRQQVLVPVVGPQLCVVTADGTRKALTELIAERLVARYDLATSPRPRTMRQAVAAFLRERGIDEAERLYRVINDIITSFDDQLSEPLLQLAGITDLQCFVSMTPDRLLAQALNRSRPGERLEVREVAFHPAQSTAEQFQESRAPAGSHRSVLNLFGRAASIPQYAIHDEDLLEWTHSLLGDPGALPDWLAFTLKHQPLLFIGCDTPEWLENILLRFFSSTRLSQETKQFFFVGSSVGEGFSSRSEFARTYLRRTQVQQLDMAPDEFVTELLDRWKAQSPSEGSRRLVGSTPMSTQTIFISYAREDIEPARRLHDRISDLGGNVWLDERRLAPGSDWEDEVLRGIRRNVRLFLPLISANTEGMEEGYMFREWREAVERSNAIPRRRFIIPVIIDDEPNEPSVYRQVPEEFRRYNLAYAPGGEPDSNLRSVLVEEMRAMRRTTSA
jgi:hypothetical protein